MREQNGTEHPSENMKRADIHTLKKGDVVFVRAIVADVDIHSFHTKVSVKEYQDYAGCSWRAKNINSVDVYALEALMPKEVGKAQETIPHVCEEGSREHVLSYDSKGRHCSIPNCEVNKK